MANWEPTTMPALFGRHRQSGKLTGELTPPPQPAPDSWEHRLDVIGHAIDTFDAPVRDVAVSVAGDHIFVSALAWRTGSFHSGWTPVTLAIEGDRAVPLR